MEQSPIYSYMTLTPFLKDFISSKEGSTAYSFRSMSNKMKNISHSHLYQIFSGKRKLPIELADDFSKKVLKLNQMESRYFKTLVEVDHHLDSMDEDLNIADLEKKLSVLKPLEIKRVEFDEILARPLTMILFIMVERNDLKNIKKINPDIFHIKYDEKVIKESLAYLVEMNIISVDGEGNITKLVESLMSANDVPNVLVRKYHKEVAGYAANLVDDIESAQREFQSFMININSADMPKAKELIRTFMSDFANQINVQPPEMDSTYCLNVQFFPTIRNSK